MSWNIVKMCCRVAAAVPGLAITTEAQESSAGFPPDSATAPVIRLVEPVPGGSIPLERPQIRYQFQPGSGGAADPSSFRVLVNGEDRSRGFSVSPAGASGSIAGPTAAGSPPLTPGVHLVTATVCSTSRACSSTTAAVVVSSMPTTPTPNTQPGDGPPPPAGAPAGAATSTRAPASGGAEKTKRRRLAEAIHAALGKLIAP
jgi:hypothetical protein